MLSIDWEEAGKFLTDSIGRSLMLAGGLPPPFSKHFERDMLSMRMLRRIRRETWGGTLPGFASQAPPEGLAGVSNPSGRDTASRGGSRNMKESYTIFQRKNASKPCSVFRRRSGQETIVFPFSQRRLLIRPGAPG